MSRHHYRYNELAFALLGWAIILGTLMLLRPSIAVAQNPQGDPTLRVRTDGHGAIIPGLDVSKDGSRLATASYDRTVRLWHLPELTPLRTIHLPVGTELEGAVYAISFSPDAKILAVTGYTGAWGEDRSDARGPWCIYVINVADGEIIRAVCDMPRIGNHLAFSKDGQYLAVALARPYGVRVYRTIDYSLAMQDQDYGNERAQFVEFDAAGRMATAGYDGQIRLYDRNLKLVAKQVMPDGRRPDGLSFSPDGTLIAVGYSDRNIGGQPVQPSIDVLSASDLSRAFRPDLLGVESGALWRVSWSSDGQFLYAGGSWQRDGQYLIRRWANRGRGRPVDTIAAAQPIVRMAKLPTGGVIYTGEMPYLGIIGPDNQRALFRQPSFANYTGIGGRFAVSRDGLVVQFTFDPHSNMVANFSVESRALSFGPAPSDQMVFPRTDHANVDIRNWARSTLPILDGAPLPLRKDEEVESLTIADDGESFILGTEWRLIRFDRKGTISWHTPIPYGAYGVVTTPDQRLVVTALGDGTIRWFATDTRKELLAFFPHRDGKRWIAWTPRGYYMASIDGEDLIGWQVNRGRTQSAVFFGAHRFRDIFYRPDIVQRVLATLDEDKAVAEADRIAGIQAQERRVLKLLPPVLEIRSHQDNDRFARREVTLQYSVHSLIGEQIIDIDIYFNGAKQDLRGPVPAPLSGTNLVSVDLILPRRDVTVTLIARSGDKESEPRSVKLVWNGPAVADPPLQPRLLALLVGVSTYRYQDRLEAAPNFLAKLHFADRDATRLNAALREQRTKAFMNVETRVLTNVDKPAIEGGLNWLKATARQDDLTMVFLSGHGKTNNNTFFFLPSGAEPDDWSSTAISGDLIISTLAKLPGLKLLVVDACRAGGGLTVGGHRLVPVELTRLANDVLQKVGLMFIGSSGVDQLSYENPAIQSGAFTQAFIEGLNGRADLNSDGRIETWELEAWLKTRVPQLAGQSQDPLRYRDPPSLEYTLAHN